jgi:gamma-glutamyltranspeptidase/glutathione hydrolase
MSRLTLILPLLLACASSLAMDRITGLPFATRSTVYAPHAMAATSHPLATQIALDTMREGGSAMDAAIAANAALGLMEPTGNGIGGDLFAIVWDPETKKLHGYNGSGRSPRSLTLEHFRKLGLSDIPPHGPLPVSVPGTVDAWFALHEKFGKRTMAQNLAPTIRYARDGHPVHETIAYYWALSVPRLAKWPGFTEQFTIDGRAPRTGELWKNPYLADTLEKIARGGREAFYEGEIARTIDAYFKANDGFLSYEDMAAHRGEWVEPVGTNYRGYDVWELPPNGQGIAALQMLNVLEAYDLKSYGFGSAEHLHLVTEAKKLAFADRARWYADPAFHPAPVAKLVSKEYAA